MIDLDNLLIVLQYFRVLAPEVVTVEVEPLDCESGESLSPAVARTASGTIRISMWTISQ